MIDHGSSYSSTGGRLELWCQQRSGSSGCTGLLSAGLTNSPAAPPGWNRPSPVCAQRRSKVLQQLWRNAETVGASSVSLKLQRLLLPHTPKDTNYSFCLHQLLLQGRGKKAKQTRGNLGWKMCPFFFFLPTILCWVEKVQVG